MNLARMAMTAALLLPAWPATAQSTVEQCYAEFDASGAAACADRLIEAANVALDEALQAAVDKAKAADATGAVAEALRRNQGAFNNYRNSSCNDAARAVAGAAAEQASDTCMVALDEQRTAWLKQLYP